MLLMLNKVVVPTPFEDEAIAKRVEGLVTPVVVETKIESFAYGVEVPMPTVPSRPARIVVEATLSVVKYAVLEA
jgi:hypothetical protein